MANNRSASGGRRKIRYAVVGLGYISQAAALPAFHNARRNSELAALVSDDETKLRKLGKKYGVENLYSYEQYEECLTSGQIDAVYIALPNHLHRDYTIRAARQGIHVLCEKPLAVTEKDCEAMIRAAEQNGVQLMTAYRLHFEEGNLRAIDTAQSGKLGDLRFFHSVFSQQVKEGDIRLKREMGGGTVYDLGVYCINAARYIFRAEPMEVTAFSANHGDPRFAEVDEMTSAVMRFPDERLAVFTSSFNAGDVSNYQVVGTKGDLFVDQAYEYVAEVRHRLTVNGKTRERTFARRDQFAPEFLHFSDCILKGTPVEPSGEEGLADVRVIRALYKSAASGGRPVRLEPFERRYRPSLEQEIKSPPVEKPPLVKAASPSGEQ